MWSFGKLLGYCDKLSMNGLARVCSTLVATVAVSTFFGQESGQNPCEGCARVRTDVLLVEYPLCGRLVQIGANNSCISQLYTFPDITLNKQTMVKNIIGDPDCRCTVDGNPLVTCGESSSSYTVRGTTVILGPCTGVHREISLIGRVELFQQILVCFDENRENSSEKILVYRAEECPYTHRVRISPFVVPGCQCDGATPAPIVVEPVGIL